MIRIHTCFVNMCMHVRLNVPSPPSHDSTQTHRVSAHAVESKERAAHLGQRDLGFAAPAFDGVLCCQGGLSGGLIVVRHKAKAPVTDRQAERVREQSGAHACLKRALVRLLVSVCVPLSCRAVHVKRKHSSGHAVLQQTRC